MDNRTKQQGSITPEVGQAAAALVDAMGGGGMLPGGGGALLQTKTQYSTAVTVQKPRDLEIVIEKFNQEAHYAGESFFYAWGEGQDHIEGVSVDAALSLARIWGNCAIETDVVEEDRSYIFRSHFIDLETGFTLSRAFRQDKAWKVYGKLDDMRKEDLRFQIGQSKSIRNVVVNAMPKWLFQGAIDIAKKAVLLKIEKDGPLKALAMAFEALHRHGITSDRIFARFGKKAEDFTPSDISGLRTAYSAIIRGEATARELFPPLSGFEDEKKAQTETPPAAKTPPPERPAPPRTTDPGPFNSGPVPGAGDAVRAEEPAQGQPAREPDLKPVTPPAGSNAGGRRDPRIPAGDNRVEKFGLAPDVEGTQFDERCPRCYGVGKSESGRQCRTCHGYGLTDAALNRRPHANAPAVPPAGGEATGSGEGETTPPPEPGPSLTTVAKQVDPGARCVACSGSGTTTTGDTCHPCNGTGLREQISDEPPPAPPAKPPATKSLSDQVVRKLAGKGVDASTAERHLIRIRWLNAGETIADLEDERLLTLIESMDEFVAAIVQ